MEHGIYPIAAVCTVVQIYPGCK